MRQTLKNIALGLVVSVLIIATGGVSIFHHICHCAGETTASVFLEAACEHENDAYAHSCCSTSEASSCCMDKSGRETKHSCQGHDCCDTSVQFLKIQDSFQTSPAKVVMKPVVVSAALILFNIPLEENLDLNTELLLDDLPPPTTGKQIILAYHQLKLDPSVLV